MSLYYTDTHYSYIRYNRIILILSYNFVGLSVADADSVLDDLSSEQVGTCNYCIHKLGTHY